MSSLVGQKAKSSEGKKEKFRHNDFKFLLRA